MDTLDPDAQSPELRVAIGQLSRRMRKIYADGPASADITFLEVAILLRLAREGPSSPSALAGQERVTSQAIAPVVSELTHRGLISRTTDETDRRRAILAITEAGHKALQSNERSVLHAISAALRSFTASEREIIGNALPLLRKLTQLL